ncbi:MAG: hypothetical protein KAT46_04820, partial [Deltaproteobacteria bacterium]|nr:hypothetical protein [Deltaproteobacteria bacterium]
MVKDKKIKKKKNKTSTNFSDTSTNEDKKTFTNFSLKDRGVLGSGFFILILSFLIYLPALGGEFLDWDDRHYVLNNLLVNNPSLASIGESFSTIVLGNWHPLTLISLILDSAVWGVNPFGFHLTNIVLHSFSSLILFLIIYRLQIAYLANKKNNPTAKANPNPNHFYEKLFIPFLSALIFALHPIHVESVAWIAERKDVLSAFFYLLSAYFYIDYTLREKRKKYRYTLSLLFFAFSLMSKPMGVTLPVALILIDIFPLKRINLKKPFSVLFEKIPFFVLSLLISIVTIFSQGGSGAIKSSEVFPLATRLLTAVRGIGFYLYKFLFPKELAPYYPYPFDIGVFSFEFILPFFLCLAITVLSIFYLKKIPLLFILWSFFLITLLPVLGIIQVGGQSAADRYMYLPSIAPIIFFSVLAFLFY